MMKREEIADELLRLATDYRHVYDGGYAEVSRIRKWARTLDPESRQILWDRLIESVANQESTMWGVALETLVEENPEKLTERLDDLLTGRMFDEGRHDIIFALLRLGYRPAATKCFNYVKEALRRTGLEISRAIQCLKGRAITVWVFPKNDGECCKDFLATLTISWSYCS
jgi:hypothetical protein